MEETLQNVKDYKSKALADEFQISSNFPSLQEFLEFFYKSALTKQVSFKIKQRNKKSLALSCKDPLCTFKVNTHLKANINKCIITNMNHYHIINCTSEYKPKKGTIKAILRDDSSLISPKELIKSINLNTGEKIKYITAYKAIERFKIDNNIVLEASYGYLSSLISTMDSESVFTKFSTSNNCFTRFFMTWRASKVFYQNSPKMITIDGTFLAGPNKGTLLVAVAQDGKEQLVLIAFAIVESENFESWKFFIENSI